MSVLPEIALKSLVTALVGLVSKPLGRRALDAAIGPPEYRAFNRACGTAVDRVVRELLDSGVEEHEVAHAITLVTRLVSARGPGGVAVIDRDGTAGADTVADWATTAEEVGLDPGTFPVSFRAVVTMLEKVIPEECARLATVEGSALFATVVVESLQQVDAGVRALLANQLSHGAARQLPIAAGLKGRLDAARAACEVADRYFYTADLLLATLDAPDGQAVACLDAAHPGRSDDVRAQVRRYVADQSRRPADPFHAFEWVERPDVRRAQEIAFDAGAAVVTGAALLLGILDTSSNTSRQLLAYLDREIDSVRATAIRLCAEVRATQTPGLILGR